LRQTYQYFELAYAAAAAIRCAFRTSGTYFAAGSRSTAKVLFFIALTIFLVILVFGVMLGKRVF